MKKTILILCLLFSFGKMNAQTNCATLNVYSNSLLNGNTGSIFNTGQNYCFDKNGAFWFAVIIGSTFDSIVLIKTSYGITQEYKYSPSIVSLSLPTNLVLTCDSNNNILCVVENLGVIKFDGINWTETNFAITTGFNAASSILEPLIDNSNKMWVKFDNNINVYSNGSIVNVYDTSSFGNMSNYNFSFSSFIVGKDSNSLYIYFSKLDQLYHFNGTAWSLYTNNVSSSWTGFNSQLELAYSNTDKFGNIYLGFYDTVGVFNLFCNYYILKFDGFTWTSNHLLASMMAPGLTLPFQSFGFDKQNNIWVFGEEAISFLNQTTGNIQYYPGPPCNYTFTYPEHGAYDDNGSVWTFDANDADLVLYNFHIHIFNPKGLKTISGNVFNDANSNGIKDLGEQPFKNGLLTLTPQNYFSSIDTSGNYFLYYFDSTLTYSVGCVPPTYYHQTSLPATYSVNPLTQSCDSLDFGIAPNGAINDLQISLTTQFNRVGFWADYWINYTNIGTTTTGDSIVLNIDDSLTFQYSYPSPTYTSGKKVVWNISSLAPFQSGMIDCYLQVSPHDTIGDVLLSQATIYSVANDSTPLNNNEIVTPIVSGAFDPNEKTVSPEGNIAANTNLTYTIYFQNTGTDTAFNIVVRDTLDSHLDIATFKLIGSSAPVNIELKNAGELAFHFNHIMLPDSNVNEPMSHGFVKYAIKPKSNTPDGVTIKNTAFIYFDYNTAVVTNTATSGVGTSSGIGVTVINSTVSALQISPNPCQDKLTVNCSSLIGKGNTILVYDVLGREVLHSKIANTETINVSTLGNGLYLVKVIDEKGKSYTAKFVKE